MARNNGRWGRLRRVLNEDLSTSTVAYSASSDRAPGDTPRYGAGANIENHPQITDYIPRRFRSIALILVMGVGLGLLAEVIAHHAAALSALTGVSTSDIKASLTDQLENWTSAIALIVAAAYARIVFLLKRHRLDDLRGRYRVWRHASWLAVLLSANAIVACHMILAHALGHFADWHPWGTDAIWWVVPALMMGGWVMVRLILDAAECRIALISFVFSAITFLGAIACAVGWSPLDSIIWRDTLNRSLPLVGYLCALAGILLTARYVVLDVQGLIEHDTDPARPAASTSSHVTRSKGAADTTGSTSEEKEVATAWVDGSKLEDEFDDDRPLSKAERKRLRKQHGRYRAA